jgi:predicted dehydrogenase
MFGQMNESNPNSDLNRRDFIRGSSFATVMALMGGVPIIAQEKPPEKPAATAYDANKKMGPPVNCAVIGCGLWGREILKALAKLPSANVVAICDTYEPFLRRSKESAPKAEGITDYKSVLANKEIKAVIVSTPSHLHKDIVVEALQAGKHVYCEAPLAASVEDARAIAQAAKAAIKQNFQAGLSLRSDSQRRFLLDFIRAGALGKTAMGRSQWHKKESWRRTAPSPERETALNWRLRSESSPGLAGEISIHQFDATSWYLNARPLSVIGFGSIMQWSDGRDVPDTIHAIFEYPNSVRVVHDCTLANSFDSDYEMLYGSEAAVMIRGEKAWMFKETDAPLLGWEVYARKDSFYTETGIALVANATKLTAHQDKATDEAPVTSTPLYQALDAFVGNTDIHHNAVQDFAADFDVNDTNALKEYLVSIVKTKAPAAGYHEGLDATVIALKTNEAVTKGQKVTFQKDWFEV